MNRIENSKLELSTDKLEETPAAPAPGEEQVMARKQWSRRRITVLGSVGTLVLAAVVTGLVVWSTPALSTIEAADTPLASPAGSLANSLKANRGTLSNAAANAHAPGSPGASSNNSAASVTNTGAGGGDSSSGDSGNGATGGNSGDNGGGGQIWHPPWDEQVWVDTSGWQSVYAGENPIYEIHDICNTCGAIVDSIAGEHILSTGHSGVSTKSVQVGSEPIYQQQWVSSGYWKTVTHPGYWS
jgi:hypothetical protein